MTDEERAIEYYNAKQECEQLNKDLKILKCRAHNYASALSFALPYLESLLDENRESNSHPKLKSFPTSEEIIAVCADVFDTEEKIRKLENILNR